MIDPNATRDMPSRLIDDPSKSTDAYDMASREAFDASLKPDAYGTSTSVRLDVRASELLYLTGANGIDLDPEIEKQLDLAAKNKSLTGMIRPYVNKVNKDGLAEFSSFSHEDQQTALWLHKNYGEDAVIPLATSFIRGVSNETVLSSYYKSGEEVRLAGNYIGRNNNPSVLPAHGLDGKNNPYGLVTSDYSGMKVPSADYQGYYLPWLTGEDAIAAIQEAEGVVLDYAQRRVAVEEGYVTGNYYDSKNVVTNGAGQTGQWMNRTFIDTFDHHVERVKGKLINFDSYPEDVQAELIQAEYRGDVRSDYKWVKQLNNKDPDYKEAAAEFLRNEDYNKSVESNKQGKPHGVAGRMRKVHKAILSLHTEN